MGLRFYFYEFCFVGGAKFNWVLFYLKQEDHQNSKTVNTKKKIKKNEEELQKTLDHQCVGWCKKDRK